MNNTAFLSGVQAIERGLLEAGASHVVHASAMCFTDSRDTGRNNTEMIFLKTMNERVGLDIAIGLSQGGKRTAFRMNFSGVKNALRSLLAAAYSGINGGMTIVVLDDPESQDAFPQYDIRHLARLAKLPLLIPSDPKEAIAFTKQAFVLSEKFDVPVLVSVNSKLCRTSAVCALAEPVEVPQKKANLKISGKRQDTHARSLFLDRQLGALQDYGTRAFDLNKIDVGSSDVGIITSGSEYEDVKEAFPEASVLKLGMAHPFPKKLIAYFAGLVKRLYVVEAMDPFFEEQINAMGMKVTGKELFPQGCELSAATIAQAFSKEGARLISSEGKPEIPPRLPQKIIPESYRNILNACRKLDLTVIADILCSTETEMFADLGGDFATLQGTGIGAAFGYGLTVGTDSPQRTVVIASETSFLHLGIPVLVNISLNGGTITCCVVREQEESGELSGVLSLDYAKFCESIGVKSFRIISPGDQDRIETALREETAKEGVSIIFISSY